MYTEDDYEQDLNEMYGDVDVCGCSYPAGMILREVDPTAFDVGYNDWCSEVKEEQGLQE